ncbi:MAG TPA: hypothetical protein VGQ18_02465 [Gemmatimonadales bacterium]|jgi:hypothetical protein|nr:hypothetical protein [Gemmatimonadales bacterium]
MKWLLRAWLLCLIAAVVGGVWRGEDLLITLLGVLALISVALVATPAIVFAFGVPREMRRSAVGSAVGNLFAGAWILTLPGRPLIASALAIGLVALGVIVVGRVLTLPPSDPAPNAPPLRHSSATVTGVITIFLLVIGYAKTFGGHPHWGHPSAATMTSDLKNLIALEDQFFSIHRRYASLTDLSGFEPSLSRATITVFADSGRVVATAKSSETRHVCIVWTGSPPLPPDSAHGSSDGVPACWEP